MLQYATTTAINPAMAQSRRNQYPQAEFRRFKNMENSIGLVLDKRYRLEKIIGQGGVGTVFRAQDLIEKKQVAVKLLTRSPKQKRAKRITQEIAALKQIQHPNIVGIENSGYFEGNSYAVLEYMKGMDLKRFLSIWKTIPWEHTQLVISQACDGLAALHGKGITHLDIKPGNVFILEDGTVKIFDFDFSDFMNEQYSDPGGVFFGTPNYISPEQFLGERPTTRSDIFSLGVTMYEILCGEAPFNAESVYGTMHKILERTPILPSEAAPEASIPKEADLIVMKAIEKKPENRFQSMMEMKEAILRVRSIFKILSLPKGDSLNIFPSDPTQPLIMLPGYDSSLISRPFFDGYGQNDTLRASASF